MKFDMENVFIVAAKRTPVGGLLGSLASYTATQLGALVIKAIYNEMQIPESAIDSVYLGNVMSAGVGQSPARQAARFAGVPDDKDATTINKVCAAGMKAVVFGAQQIQLGIDNVVLAGGMESMSNTPHYAYMRNGNKFGHATLTDGMIKDGLWDVYHDFHMGNAAEIGIRHFGFTREQLDNFALNSYKRAQEATQKGKFSNEIVPVPVRYKKEESLFVEDEDIYKVIPEKMASLPSVFEKDGLLTAANSSNLNDGASVLLLASEGAVAKYNLKPLAKIIGYADAAQAPEWFTTTPAVAIPKALKKAGLELEDIDYYEINEAYASVILSMQELLGISPDKINVYGGAVAIGHPIGASGARILTTLTHVLQQENGKYGVAAICNGGGGATAIVIEKM
ncbi:acetyl-CoA C-acyltransferase [Elizabethkingia anophelis]|uniref:acetyl-CoA C-acyltransferase n=1 Tax=Elizabethkingia anophelis TaxID=1117645 RepID=UPI00077EB3C0|nr:acetyl-CoA C-acyltransferase [Elizabethkingia anophelis]AMR42984.1 acetyl-CoA acetyltransferase [Elizabethkingia anophelis]AMX49626.1 acetyl-CoA acetyltransferase [Elizabethkingia anophelis]AMX56476.1 acetyl-CoA acetyltransferase [Elizabethkingia anophelis]EGT4348776.1 acetyl-CoA C-acyltransferase [Elizabethkingia anophelis]EJG2053212.1 acetyl-CoA C-acyltransferase [Elizabethkingia anophelis]